MFPPSNNTIPLTHTGAGIVTFPVPRLSEKSKVRLNPKCQTSGPSQNEKMMERPLIFEILKIGGKLQNLIKKNGSFYAELLHDGFLKNGAITLIGLMPAKVLSASGLQTEPIKIMKTVIQLDGDIICQIDKSVLKEQHVKALIQGFTVVQDQFFEGFKSVLTSIRRVIILLLSLLIPAIYLIWKMISL